MRRRLTAVLSATAVAAALLAPVATSAAVAAPAAAPPATVPAAASPGAVRAATLAGCVNKRTGALRVLKKASATCRKTERKVRWAQTGPAGPAGATGATGPMGPQLNVLAADGTVIGTLMGVLLSEAAVWVVLRDGGIYYYYNDGSLLSVLSSETVKYTNNTCTSPAYFKVSGAPPGLDAAGLLGGYTRVMYRTDGGAVPTWRVTTTATPLLVATQLYYLTTAGVCQASGAPSTGTLYLMESVTSPPASFPGPLRVG